MAASSLALPRPRPFSVYISYASEDRDIANAVATSFRTALNDVGADVQLDTEFLEPGSPWQSQLEQKLLQTNVLIILYSGVRKPSHGYTGWEIGYFDRIMRDDSAPRKKIALYLDVPPDVTAPEQGIWLGVSKEQLRMSPEQFESSLCVSPEEPLCREISNWQTEVDKIIAATGLTVPHRKSEQDPVKCVRNLRLAIFQHLRETVESKVEPQRRITIRVKGSDLDPSSQTLPPGAILRPVEAELRTAAALGKGGSMSLFGLSDETITWKDFLEKTKDNRYAESWWDAIATVVLSAFPDRVDVDNSQIILASDGRTVYRLILTTATKSYDDFREYNLYFVEALQRPDSGDGDTTQLLKGLEISCRFRSLFLEDMSDFLGQNLRLTDIHKLPELAATLLTELNLMHRDAQQIGLDKPGWWAKFVDIEQLTAIAEAYRPCETRLREIIPQILAAKGDRARLEPLRHEAADELTKMETAVRPRNAALLRAMASALNRIVEKQDQAKPA